MKNIKNEQNKDPSTETRKLWYRHAIEYYAAGKMEVSYNGCTPHK